VPRKAKPLYRTKPPKARRETKVQRREPKSGDHATSTLGPRPSTAVFPHAHPLPASHFELREDGSIASESKVERRETSAVGDRPQGPSTLDSRPSTPALVFSRPGLWLYHGNCLELLDAIAAKYPDGRFDAIFADPPYFLSNGGITCHAGKMVKVDKGDWDVSRGPELTEIAALISEPVCLEK